MIDSCAWSLNALLLLPLHASSKTCNHHAMGSIPARALIAQQSMHPQKVLILKPSFFIMVA